MSKFQILMRSFALREGLDGERLPRVIVDAMEVCKARVHLAERRKREGESYAQHRPSLQKCKLDVICSIWELFIR